MKIFLLCLILFLAVLLEGAVITLPLALILLLFFYIFNRKFWVFPAAFIFGILLDVVSFRTIGVSSIFFTIFLFVLSLYERKFETLTILFVLFSSFLGSLAFLLIFKYNYVLLQSTASSLIAILMFKIFSRTERKRMLAD